LLIRAGLVPMLLFCLAFVAARTVANWLWELQRLLIGPEDLGGFWMPLSWPLSRLNDAAGHVVLVCLLAAAVDRALHASQGDLAAPDQAVPDPEPHPEAGADGSEPDPEGGSEPWRYPEAEPEPWRHPGDQPGPWRHLPDQPQPGPDPARSTSNRA
jgi:hypothetical protein